LHLTNSEAATELLRIPPYGFSFGQNSHAARPVYLSKPPSRSRQRIGFADRAYAEQKQGTSKRLVEFILVLQEYEGNQLEWRNVTTRNS
jgi:hypothetical protein